MNGDAANGVSETALRGAAEPAGHLAEKLQETVRQTQARLNDLQRELVDRSKAAAETTDTYVRENPWNAALAACAAGFVLGLIIGRR